MDGSLKWLPQGSVLSPTLLTFTLMTWTMILRLKFADDAKLIGRVDSKDDVGRLKMDLISLGGWAEKWQMKFNVEKCKILNIGFRK